MIVRVLLLGAVLFASFFHLAYEGHRQRQLRLAIHRAQEEITWAQDQWHIARAHVQKTFFEIYQRPLLWGMTQRPLLAQKLQPPGARPPDHAD